MWSHWNEVSIAKLSFFTKVWEAAVGCRKRDQYFNTVPRLLPEIYISSKLRSKKAPSSSFSHISLYRVCESCSSAVFYSNVIENWTTFILVTHTWRVVAKCRRICALQFRTSVISYFLQDKWEVGLVRDLGSVGKKDLPICFSQGYKHISIFLESFTRGSGRRHCLVRPKQQNRKLSKSDVEQNYRSSFFLGKSSASSKLFCKFTSRKSWEKIFLEFGSISDPNCCS